jgi:N6-adenosine-specific RNA methylase IME4
MASRAVSSAIIAPVGKHSAKPPIVRDKIVQLVGDVPRIELFARQACEGWDAWGNEELA